MADFRKTVSADDNGLISSGCGNAAYKTVIFVNGCFWHQHPNCSRSKLPVANAEYWKNKLQKNVINDRIHREQLQQMGWTVIYLWECELKKDFIGVMDAVIKVMQGTVN